MHALYEANPEDGRFPEWILQELDSDWLVEFPSSREATLYVPHRIYLRGLLRRLGSGDGKDLERIGQYVLGTMPGCRAHRRKTSESTDYDIVCTLEGADLDLRSDLGRYFICECKDWSSPADFTAFAKFCRVLDSAKCRFGILFSKVGISGAGRTQYAAREQLKVFQDRGLVIIVLTEADLTAVAEGGNLISMPRSKNEAVRLDLREPPAVEKKATEPQSRRGPYARLRRSMAMANGL